MDRGKLIPLLANPNAIHETSGLYSDSQLLATEMDLKKVTKTQKLELVAAHTPNVEGGIMLAF